MLALNMEFCIRSKHVKIVAEIFVIPRNMSFAVLPSSLLLRIRFNDDKYSRTFYKYSLFIIH